MNYPVCLHPLYCIIVSVRKRMVQKLNDEGVPANQIVQISGHKKHQQHQQLQQIEQPAVNGHF